ncbi:alkyl hydroperoxide reductase [Acidobacteria bacterium Mor1]|nr:alkyl hydroperoxide reductase [Acidobacteria bacterium Mor1]
MRPTPKAATPELSVETVGGGRFVLAERKPQHFTMLVFYRGLHCPLCRKQLQELESMLPDFRAAGIEPVAVSANTRELAERSVEEWELKGLTVGYGLSLEDADRWGLFVSAAVKDTEPERFTEPGLFFVRPDGTLYASSVQTMPFARPPAKNLLSFLQFVIENDYPARGEVER